jgi:hypothetical protein
VLAGTRGTPYVHANQQAAAILHRPLARSLNRACRSLPSHFAAILEGCRGCGTFPSSETQSGSCVREATETHSCIHWHAFTSVPAICDHFAANR